jgi:SAM-dependent methyltransferase
MSANSFARRVAQAPLPPALRRPMKWAYRRWFRSRASQRGRQPIPLAVELRAAVQAGDTAEIQRLIVEFRRLRVDVEEALSPALRRTKNAPIELATGTQSKQFMIDLLPHIQQHLTAWPRGSRLDVLEVGPGSGHGTALLSSLYASSELGYRMRVTAVDIRDDYHNYFELVAPYARHRIADIFTMDETFDIVIASHVIEHVPDPAGFCRRLQELSRDVVFIAAPYNEPRDRLTTGHCNVIDQQFIEALDPLHIAVVNSVAWGAFCDPPYEMVIAKLRGIAQKEAGVAADRGAPVMRK